MPTPEADEALDIVLREARRDSDFADRAMNLLEKEAKTARRQGSRRTAAGHPQNRRPPGVLNPYSVYETESEPGLRDALARLDIEQLKDIVAEHGMDRSKLAMKWKTPDRLIDLIVQTVVQRAHKGDAFRS